MIGAEWRFGSLHWSFPQGARYFHTSSASSLIIAKLRPLLLLGKDVALLGRGKAALRREAELLQRSELGRLVDAALDVVLLLQRAALGGDEAEHHDLVALRQEAQRLEAAGAVGVVFEEIAVVVHLAQQRLRHRLVAALGNPGRAEIAAADMGGDRHVGGLAFERRVDRRARRCPGSSIDIRHRARAPCAAPPASRDRPRPCRRTADSGSRRRRTPSPPACRSGRDRRKKPSRSG